MPRLLPKRFARRPGRWGTVLLLWDLWKRIPPKHRKRILTQARKHGPKLVTQALKRRRSHL